MTAAELFPTVLPGSVPSAEMLPDARVFAVDGVVHIRELATVDPDLRGLVQTASDPEAYVQNALSTGARTLAIAQASVDTQLVEDSFTKLLDSLRIEIVGAGTTVSSATGDLLKPPTAGVAASLAQWRGTIETLMDSTFKPDRSTSAFGKLDQILADGNTDQFNATRRLLNPDTDDSPMARLLASVQS